MIQNGARGSLSEHTKSFTMSNPVDPWGGWCRAASDFIVDIVKYTCELPTRGCRGEPKENPQKNEPGYTVVILQKNLSPNKTSIYRKLYNVEWAKAPLARSYTVGQFIGCLISSTTFNLGEYIINI